MTATAKRLLAVFLTTLGLFSLTTMSAGPAVALSGSYMPGYFLVVGDGNAKGYDPLQTDDTYSYARKVFAKIKAVQPNVQMVNLACKGETTTTYLYGGKCNYSAGSQYRQVAQFLSSHWGQVRFISLNIGGWDVYQCISMKNQTQDIGCVVGGIAAVGANMGIIVGGLRLGALTSRIVVNTAYDAYTLALLLGTKEGNDQASQALTMFQTVNLSIKAAAGLNGARVADMFAAMAAGDTTPVVTPMGTFPRAVVNLCTRTHACNLAIDDVHFQDNGGVVQANLIVAQL